MKVEIENIQTRDGHYWRIIWYTRPLGWWRHKIIGSLAYKLHHKRILGDKLRCYCLGLYYNSLNKMCDTYKINWYGIPDLWIRHVD